MPDWSPDGSKIAFDQCVNCQVSTNHVIFVYDMKADSVSQLTELAPGVSNTNPTWGPDGNKIAFVSDRDYYNADTLRFRKDLYVINIDGTNLKRLTNSGSVDIPSWQPDGDLIAYAWQHKDPEIFLFNLATNQVQKLTDLKYVGKPIWSSKGNLLLIPATTKNNVFVFQYINPTGRILHEVPIKIKDIQGLDWFISKKS